MEGTQNGTAVPASEQYKVYCEDYDRDNLLKWFCHGCQDQDKKITQREMPIAWGKMKDIKETRKSLNLAYQKIVGWKKTTCKSQEEKSEKHKLQARSVSSHRTL